MQKELLEELDLLHEKNCHKEIVRKIGTLPEEVQREYEIQGRLGRALGNLGEVLRAREVLEGIRKEGEKDPLWWYRLGCCYLSMEDGREASRCFRRSLELEPEGEVSEDCRKLIRWAADLENTDKGCGGKKGKGNKW